MGFISNQGLKNKPSTFLDTPSALQVHQLVKPLPIIALSGLYLSMPLLFGIYNYTQTRTLIN